MNTHRPTFSTPHLWHGGDYNPEQWPRETWDADDRLMDLAHWNVATIGVFSWVSLEPEEGRFTFEWLDEIFERLHRNDRHAILATPSAAQPAWMSQAYPEILRTGHNGQRNRHGNRVNYCLTSPVYRERCRAMAQRLAERYGNHPALAMWHVSNEYGGDCRCALCEEAFRDWLRAKFDNNLDNLNAAYWTAFWSHTYTDWSQIEIPGAPAGEEAIHGLTIDWRRFVTDQTISFYENEAEVLRAKTPSIPITTNFMGFYPGLDYTRFGKHVDIVSWDSYPRFSGPLTNPDTWISVAMAHDFMRGCGGGKPFLLMECTPSASNWYPVMELKTPGMHSLEGIQAVAHGSDSVQYFQWRQSRGSGEKFHGAVVQQDGTNKTRVFQEVASLGARLEELSDVAGTRVKSEVAIIYDVEVAWAIEAACGPLIGDRGYLTAVKDFYRPLWESGISVDIISSEASLAGYRLVLAPMLYSLKPGVAERLIQFTEEGGTVVGTYWSGISDENDLCFLGGYPGPLRPLFGIWSEEIDVLDKDQVRKVDVTDVGFPGVYTARTLCDQIHLEGAEVLARYADGWYAGRPALTCNSYGEGEAYYVASRNDQAFNEAFLGSLVKRLNIRRAVEAELPAGVTAQRRIGTDGETVFLLNCTGNHYSLVVDAEQIELAAYGTAVLTRLKSAVADGVEQGEAVAQTVG